MTLTAIELAFKLKDFDNSDPDFIAALKFCSLTNFQHINKKSQNDIDNGVKKEEAINLIIDILYEPSKKYSLGNKEKNLFKFIYSNFRKALLKRTDVDISIYDTAYEDILNILKIEELP